MSWIALVIEFVARKTDAGSPQFVKEVIEVIDNENYVTIFKFIQELLLRSKSHSEG